MTTPVRVLSFGGCLLHGPISKVVSAGASDVAIAKLSRGGGTPPTYTIGEMLQTLALYRNEIEMTPDIRVLCGVKAEFAPLPRAGELFGVDVAILEPQSPIDIRFREYSLHRAAIKNAISSTLKGDEKLTKAADRWLNKGFMLLDDEYRKRVGAEIADQLDDDAPMVETFRAVLREAYPERKPIESELRELVNKIGRPVGVLTYMFQFMPDGRPVSWPAGFHEEVVAAAQALNLPVFEPWRVVQAHGVSKAMKPDLRHYQEEFLPVIAREICNFVRTVSDRGGAAWPVSAAERGVATSVPA
ncbi:hypothetical protein CWB41_07250 [Methylovirgula ligni]|uniref:Uncharacterized protein n=2 Tax=Methylovirgula ligni TaxID=569860 RepID=A0A3D9Z4F1_9HYPH|nr:hypothetical protein [Methylovirgula ligni]QAY95557.1 hypothetical protein CWB41_07250 [Methylovirgula ligni]REF89100.1 hypothetical protein DES32_0314 [Methylovirgula ligni]